MPTTTYIYLFGDGEPKIWGLTGQERLRRMFNAQTNVTFIDNVDKIPSGAATLFLNANFLFDGRVLNALLGLDKKVALYSVDGCPAAIRSDGDYAQQLLRNLDKDKDHNYKFALLTISRIRLDDLQIDF